MNTITVIIDGLPVELNIGGSSIRTAAMSQMESIVLDQKVGINSLYVGKIKSILAAFDSSTKGQFSIIKDRMNKINQARELISRYEGEISKYTNDLSGQLVACEDHLLTVKTEVENELNEDLSKFASLKNHTFIGG